MMAPLRDWEYVVVLLGGGPGRQPLLVVRLTDKYSASRPDWPEVAPQLRLLSRLAGNALYRGGARKWLRTSSHACGE